MLKVATFFSGIGAPEKALERLKIPHEVVHYCEIDKYAVKSYKTIHNPQCDNLGDITKVNTSELKDFDLMVYGFPCQDISIAGKQRGLSEGSGTRSSLLWKALEIIKEKKPKYAIAENVKNLMSDKFEEVRKRLFKYLEEIGYNSYAKVLNAKDYGIPQNRERVFIVSIRKDVDKGFVFPKQIPLKMCLKDILESKVDEKYNLSENYLKKVNVDITKETSYTVANPLRSRDFNCFMKIFPTLMARDYKDPKVTIINDKIRKVTEKEYWIGMGFDEDDFYKAQKVNSSTQLYKQAGNSIVVNVFEAILKSLFDDTPKSLFAFEF